MPIDPVSKLAIAIGGRILSGLLFQKKAEDSFDDTPTTLAALGSYIPLVLGARRVGPIHVWWGNRFTKTETIKTNGKGFGAGSGGKSTIYYEEGVHVFSVGPGRALRRIIVQGETLFEGPLSPATFPSGSEVNLGSEGRFQIYWGFEDDPIDPWLADSGRLGVSSRWPFMFRINWLERRLGQVAQWPVMDYEVEVEPTNYSSNLPLANAWFEGALEAKPDKAKTIIGISQTSSAFYVNGDQSADLASPDKVIINNSPGIPSGTEYTVVAVNVVEAGDTPLNSSPYPCSGAGPGIGTGFTANTPFANSQIVTEIKVAGGLPSDLVDPFAICYFSTDDPVPQDTYGSLVPVSENDNNGANHAYMISQVLFSEFPNGINLDSSLWDLNSILSLSELIISEGIRGSFNAETGQTAQSLIDEALLDLGVLLRLNPDSGLLEFKPMRPIDDSEVIDIPAEALLDRLPEIRSTILSARVNRRVFTFKNRNNNYRDDPIVIGNDGQAELAQYEGADKTSIPTVVDFDSAAVIAQRRSKEYLGSLDQLSLPLAGYKGRSLRPGDVIRVPDYPLPALVLEATPDPDGPGAEVLAQPDGYLVPTAPSALQQLTGGEVTIPDASVAQARLWEPPAALTVTSADVEVVLLWIRGNTSTSTALLNLSAGGLSYTPVGAEPNYASGGTLSGPIPASGSVSGVFFSIEGPDIALVPDLTGDATGAAAGKLLAIIDEEVFFCSGVSVTGVAAELLGLVRAQAGTVEAAHSAGAQVYLVENQNWTPQVSAALLQSGQAVAVKVQPTGAGDSPSLDEITPFEFTPA